MFELSGTWWEPAARAAIVYVALLVLVRISGKRTVGQFTSFDLLVVMLLSESVSGALNGSDQSVQGGLLAAATLIALNGLAGLAAARSSRLEKLLDGEPVLLGRDGQRFDRALRRHRISQQDFDEALREADCLLPQMRLAVLEADGTISILKKRTDS